MADHISFSVDGEDFTKKDLEITSKMSEEFFGTKNDSAQFQVCFESKEWMFRNQKYLNVIKSRGLPIGYCLIFPSTGELMNKFCSGRLTENELFHSIMTLEVVPNAIYLCASIIEPTFRRRGLATTGFVKLIHNMVFHSKYKPVLFYWGYSSEGEKLARRVASLTGLSLTKRVQ